ncbi:hypothetical protein N7451_007804 [Penicillium sp. IBT 35674x]|nr:hypothetical protein N7451_007804 [Penicillium sp. IBT 35674x]
MLISRKYARHLGLEINRDLQNRLEVEMGDGSTARTSGVVRNVPWSVGGKEIHCDFYVLDSLCVDVVLSNNYLFEFEAFSEFPDHFIDASVEDCLQLCNIRLIGQYVETLSSLEEEYLSDINSTDAFGDEKVQRELARRDHIRDKIMTLPEEQRNKAITSENERQRRWENLRESHSRRLQSRITDIQPSNGDSGASGPVAVQGIPLAKPTWRDRLKGRLRASLRRDLP